MYEVLLNEKRLGIFLARVDTLYNGEKELVILFGVAEKNIERPLISVLNPVFDGLARKMNIKTIRLHSERKGINRVLNKNGYSFQEAIFVKRIDQNG